MMRKIKIKISRNWWSNTTSAFVGTLMGIVITFGTTAYIENNREKKLNDKIIIYSMRNIDMTIESIEKLQVSLEKEDSLFSFIYNNYPDNLEQIADSTIAEFIEALKYYNVQSPNKSAESIFTNNIETLQTANDIILVENISACFSLIKGCYDRYEKIYALRQKNLASFFINYKPNKDSKLSYHREILVQYMSDRSNQSFLTVQSADINLAKIFLYKLEERHKENIEYLGLTK